MPARIPIPETTDRLGVTAPRASAPSDRPGPDGELVGRRTERSRTFALPDGSFRTELASVPLHAKGADGKWSPVSTRLSAMDGPADGPGQPARQLPPGLAADTGFATTSAAAAVAVPRAASGPLRITGPDGSWVQMQLPGARGRTTAQGSTATVAGALPGVDLAWTAKPAGLKETLTLASAQSPDRFVFTLRTSPGTTPRLTDDGQLEVTAQGGELL